jgi:hypothetical protein
MIADNKKSPLGKSKRLNLGKDLEEQPKADAPKNWLSVL